MKLTPGILVLALFIFSYNALAYAQAKPKKDSSQKAGSTNQTTYNPNDVLPEISKGKDLLDIYTPDGKANVEKLFDDFIGTQSNGYDLLSTVLSPNAWQFMHSVQELTKFVWVGHRHADDEEINQTLLAELHHLVEQLENQTRKIQLKAAHKRATKELRWRLIAYGTPTWGKVKRELQVVWEIIEPEIREHRFAHIDASKGEYLRDLLGDPTARGLPR